MTQHVDIVYRRHDDQKERTVSFSGDNCSEQAMRFIYNSQPVSVLTVRIYTSGYNEAFVKNSS